MKSNFSLKAICPGWGVPTHRHTANELLKSQGGQKDLGLGFGDSTHSSGVLFLPLIPLRWAAPRNCFDARPTHSVGRFCVHGMGSVVRCGQNLKMQIMSVAFEDDKFVWHKSLWARVLQTITRSCLFQLDLAWQSVGGIPNGNRATTSSYRWSAQLEWRTCHKVQNISVECILSYSEKINTLFHFGMVL